MSTPRSMRWRASPPNRTSFAGICLILPEFKELSRSRGLLPARRVGGGSARDDAHDVGLLHDQQLLAVDLDLGARPLAEQDAVAGLDVERNKLPGLIAGTRAGGD